MFIRLKVTLPPGCDVDDAVVVVRYAGQEGARCASDAIELVDVKVFIN